MVELSLSDTQIAARVGVSAPTIRKFMGSPEGELGATSRKALLAYYREVAKASGTPMDEPPTTFIVSTESGNPTDLATAIDRLTVELEAMRLEREAWRRGVVEVLRSYRAGQVPEGLLDALAPRLPEDAQPSRPGR